MNIDFFADQVRRLKDTFGDKYYSKERYTLFWNTFRNEREDIIKLAVDNLICNQKFAPLLKEISEAVELAHQQDREFRLRSFREPDLNEMVKTSHNPEFAKLCNSIIQKCVSGQMEKPEYADAMKYIDTYCDSLEKAEGRNYCKKCGDTGLQFTIKDKGYRFVNSCTCSKSKPILDKRKR